MKSILKQKKGQGMTEYILIIALIALVAIAAVQMFGTQIKQQFQSMASAISGDAGQ